MNSPFSLSMNSSRPYESFVEKQNLNKENIQVEKEKDEKLKELLDKNERLEKECIKFQIQVKNLEDKLQKFKEKEYKVKFFAIVILKFLFNLKKLNYSKSHKIIHPAIFFFLQSLEKYGKTSVRKVLLTFS